MRGKGIWGIYRGKREERRELEEEIVRKLDIAGNGHEGTLRRSLRIALKFMIILLIICLLYAYFFALLNYSELTLLYMAHGELRK